VGRAQGWIRTLDAMVNSERDITVINVVSTSYSGSTWLNLLLGSHAQAFSVGEIKSVATLGRAVCTLHGEQCPVWSQFQYPGGPNPFVQLQQLTGKRIQVVNNSRKFLHHQRELGIRARYIHLIRDGRAVTASFLRKFPGTKMWRTARLWAHDVRRNERLMRSLPAADRCLVIYEQIKADPEGELRRVCAFLDLEYEPTMLEFWTREHHFLGGNRGTLLSMLRKHQKQAELPASALQQPADAPAPDWGMDYYKRVDPGRFEDYRWKEELTDAQLRVFGLWAGRVNRRYGYPPSLDRHTSVA
jgi:hypothetical protein